MCKKIVIVGVGALGSHLVLFARNWGDDIRLVDFDKVESKNMQGQFHTKMGNRQNKTQALKQALLGMFNRQLEVRPVKLSKDNAQELLGDAALVIDCVDNGDTRRIIQAFVRKYNIPCLHGCLSAAGDYSRIVWDEDFNIDDEDAPGQATCEAGEQLPFFAAAGAQIALAAQEFLETGKRVSLEMLPFSTMRLH